MKCGSCIQLLKYTSLKYVCKVVSFSTHYVVVLEPDPSCGEEKGSGHHLAFELSPGRNVDLMNQKR